ncbi:hypothetical protein LCGC14_1811530 [marine sediment metagenome]|uniref:Uncharacterized protein n=1 Tax=marine sediment metagenome TaxID=412755 RepID=A0A0F9GLP1_9ZZZZ
MGSLGNTVENEVLDQLFGASDYAEPATYYVGLSKADVLDDASGLDEPSGNSYARVSIANNKTTWSNASGGALENDIAITFPQASGDWGTCTHFAIWNHASATAEANLIAHGALGTSKAVDNGDTARIAAGELDITLD